MHDQVLLQPLVAPAGEGELLEDGRVADLRLQPRHVDDERVALVAVVGVGVGGAGPAGAHEVAGGARLAFGHGPEPEVRHEPPGGGLGAHAALADQLDDIASQILGDYGTGDPAALIVARAKNLDGPPPRSATPTPPPAQEVLATLHRAHQPSQHPSQWIAKLRDGAKA